MNASSNPAFANEIEKYVYWNNKSNNNIHPTEEAADQILFTNFQVTQKIPMRVEMHFSHLRRSLFILLFLKWFLFLFLEHFCLIKY